MTIAIIGVGIANPAYRRRQQDTAEIVANALNLKPARRKLLKSIYHATGIEYRHSVLSDYCKSPGQFEFFPNHPDAPFPTTAARMQIYKAHALTLALSAIENCFQSVNQFDKNKITHLIVISCTGMYAPGIDIEIVEQLQLASSTQRTSIQFMGCYGVFNGIKVADAICKAEPHAVVLVVSVELCTIHFQKESKIENIISNAIFADGAAAAIIQAHPQQKKFFQLETFYCDLLPQTQREMAWHIADYGFDISLSSYVPEAIKSGVSAFMHKLLRQQGILFSSVDFFAIHPGGIKILQACEEALNLDKESNQYSYAVLREYGNMSSATILFVLKKIWDEIHVHDHAKTIFSCAFGPGLTLESMLLKIYCIV